NHGQAEPVAPPLLREGVGLHLPCIVLEEKPVGHVLAAARREILLAKARRPSQPGQDRPDEVILGLALIRGLRGRKSLEYAPEIQTKGFNGSIINMRPVR